MPGSALMITTPIHFEIKVTATSRSHSPFRWRTWNARTDHLKVGVCVLLQFHFRKGRRMSTSLKLRLFAHSWRSDWNHGNAHFLRGLAHALVLAGHDVRCYEPEESWSLTHLMEEGERGLQALEQFSRCFPELDVRTYSQTSFETFAD